MKTYLLVRIAFLSAFILIGNRAPCQQAGDEALIRASQGAASALLFSPDTTLAALLNIEKFYYARECIVRDGLPHVLSLLESDKPTKIAYRREHYAG